jgi:hypothetical protein
VKWNERRRGLSKTPEVEEEKIKLFAGCMTILLKARLPVECSPGKKQTDRETDTLNRRPSELPKRV